MTISTDDMEKEIFKQGAFSVRHWKVEDREAVAALIKSCLEEYGLEFEPQGADQDALEVEKFFHREGRGEFWVVVDSVTELIVGTAAYYEVEDNSIREKDKAPGKTNSVEIRKMYLASEARGKKLGRALLQVLNFV